MNFRVKVLDFVQLGGAKLTGPLLDEATLSDFLEEILADSGLGRIDLTPLLVSEASRVQHRFSILLWRPAFQRAVGSDLIVVPPPDLYDLPRMFYAHEPVDIQTFVTQPSVEALGEEEITDALTSVKDQRGQNGKPSAHLYVESR